MTRNQTKRISKKLSLLLRHHPERFGLTLDQQGWCDVEILLQAFQRKNINLDREMLDHVVDTNDKKRFAYNEDGTKIRASQGHSIKIDLGYEPVVPPEQLFHGTAIRNIESIKRNGLQKAKRHHVHLSGDEETAIKVGGRHGKPVVLIIQAKAMHEAGIPFFRSQNGVWLTEEVKADFIDFPNEQIDPVNKNNISRGDTSFFDKRELKVVAFVRYWHRDHKRKYTFEPYANHLIVVATTIKQVANDSCMVAAALCHDLYEDTACPQEDLLTALAEASFSSEEVQRINKWVWELTDEYTHDRYPEFNRKKRHELEADRRGKMSAKAQTIKYADLIDNLSDIKENDPKFYKLFSAEAALALEKMTKGDEELRNRALNLLNC